MWRYRPGMVEGKSTGNWGTQKTKKANLLINRALAFMFADWTGLEPATSAVTGRHSNQLNYQSRAFFQKRGKDSISKPGATSFSEKKFE